MHPPHILPQYRKSSSRWYGLAWAAALIVVIGLAFALRVYAVGWGLPYVDHPDEPSAANTALDMLRRGDWNPQFFQKPSLYYYALRLAFEAHWRYGLANGLYTDIAQLPLGTYYYMTAPGFFAWGRALTAAFGAITVAALFVIGRRWWGAPVSLIAAGLLAVLPYHVRHSQYLTVDVLTGLMMLLALGAALRLLDDGRWRGYALAGLAVGLATATKYNACIVATAVVAAHTLHWRRASLRQFGRLLWAGLWSLIGFGLGTPYVLLASDTFFNDLLNQYAFYADDTIGDAIGRWPLGAYLAFFWNTGGSPLICVSALLGVAVALRRRDRAALVLLGFAVPYLLFFLVLPSHFFRNLIPLLLVLVLFSGIGVVALAGWLARLLARPDDRQPDRSTRPAPFFAISALVVVGAIASGPLYQSVEQTQLYAQTHSKVCAGDYVRNNLSPGMPLRVELHAVEWADQPFVLPIGNGETVDHTAAWYRAQGYRYLVANVRRNGPERYARLREAVEVLAVCPGEQGGQPGSRMEVLDLGTHLDALAITRREAVFGDRLRLLGFQQGSGALRSAFEPLEGAQRLAQGENLRINLYWQPLVPLETDYAIFLHLLDADGQLVAQRDTPIRAADYPTSRWQPEELVIDLADLPLPADLAPGTYRLDIGVYDMATQQRLSLPDAANDALSLTSVEVLSAED